MALVFNPFTGNFDNVMASSSDMSFSGGSLNVNGDLTLDSGGAFTTTVQAVPPLTTNRTITFPDQTGTVGLVSGATGNIQYNNAGQLAGTGDLNVELNWTDTLVTYTGLKVNVTNTASAAGSNLLDLESNGTSLLTVSKDAKLSVSGSLAAIGHTLTSGGGVGILNTRLSVGSAGSIKFAASAPGLGEDVGFKRDSAGIIAITDGSTGLGTLQGQLRAQGTAPASSTDPGTIGDIRVDGTYLYVYNGSQWTRVQLDTTAF